MAIQNDKNSIFAWIHTKRHKEYGIVSTGMPLSGSYIILYPVQEHDLTLPLSLGYKV